MAESNSNRSGRPNILLFTPDQLRADAPEIEPLASRDDCRKDSVGFSGAEHENHVVRGLFQCLQEGIRGSVGQHMGFIDDVDLALALGWREVYLLPDVSDLIDATVAGGIQFDDVHELAAVDRVADGASVAGVSVLGVQAVHGFGDDPGGGGLAAASGAAE